MGADCNEEIPHRQRPRADPSTAWNLLSRARDAAAADVSEIELRRLFDPTETELAAESGGRIYIYEGLRDIDVQRAMDQEFDRVEYMMFIRTRKTKDTGELAKDPETGVVETQDDGC
jgi:hypothetical protein